VRVLVTGASGLVGGGLVPALAAEGHAVVRLGRSAARGADVVWEPAAGRLPRAALEGLDAVVHLAGESIAARRWSEQRRRALVASRVQPTLLLATTLATLERPPRVLVSASAVGIYGDRGDERLDERAAPGSGFLAELARAWEAATEPAAARGIRVVRLRLGLVLAAGGGLVARLVPWFRLGLGGPLGSGRQWMSWIAEADLIAAIRHAIARADLSGAVNAVAPGAVTNRDFARALGAALGRPAWLPAPAPLLRAAFGAMAREALLAGQRAIPARLLATGFEFRFPELAPALRHLLGHAASGARGS